MQKSHGWLIGYMENGAWVGLSTHSYGSAFPLILPVLAYLEDWFQIISHIVYTCLTHGIPRYLHTLLDPLSSDPCTSLSRGLVPDYLTRSLHVSNPWYHTLPSPISPSVFSPTLRLLLPSLFSFLSSLHFTFNSSPLSLHCQLPLSLVLNPGMNRSCPGSCHGRKPTLTSGLMLPLAAWSIDNLVSSYITALAQPLVLITLTFLIILCSSQYTHAPPILHLFSLT